MASIRVSVFMCAFSLALFVVVSGKPLAKLFEQFKTAVINKNCEFPAKETYSPSPLDSHFTLEPCLAAYSRLDVNNTWFAFKLCSTIFNTTVKLCDDVKKSGSNYLSTSALNKLIFNPNWNVCNATNHLTLMGYTLLSFMVDNPDNPSQCNSLCGDESELSEVCNLLVASVYIFALKDEKEKKASSAGSSAHEQVEQKTEVEVPGDKKHGGPGSSVAGGNAQVNDVPGANMPASDDTVLYGATDVHVDDTASKTPRQDADNPNISRLQSGASASDTRDITQGGTPHDDTNSESQSHDDTDLDESPGGRKKLPIPDPKEGINIETEPTPAPAQLISVPSGGNPGTGSLSSSSNGGNLQSLGNKKLNPSQSEGDSPVADSSRGDNQPTPAAGTQKPDLHQPALVYEGTPIPYVPGPKLDQVPSNQEGQDVGGSSTQGTAVPEITKGLTKTDDWSPSTDQFEIGPNGHDEDSEDRDSNIDEDFVNDNTRKTAGHSEDNDDERKTAGEHSEDDDDRRKTGRGYSEGLEDKHREQNEDQDILEEKEQNNKNPSPDKLEETGGGDGGREDRDKQPVWKGSSGYEEEEEAQSGHFMAYFVTAVVLCISGYVIYHNKQKIFAFLLEGRREGQRRRTAAGTGGGAKYSKLQPSVEEVMPSLEKSTTSKSYVY